MKRKLANKYIKWYLSLVKKARIKKDIKDYQEKHHIFPRSIFGDNNYIVKLTPREHFIAHKLLYKICLYRYGQKHARTYKMLKAISFMITRKEIKYNSRMYNECRKAFSLYMQGDNNPSIKYGFSEEHRKKISIAIKGKKHSEEHKNKLKIASKKRFKKYGSFFNEAAYKKSLQTRINNSKRFDFLHKELKLLEENITITELIKKYYSMNLNAGNLRSTINKTKKGLCKYHKGWTIVKKY